MEDIFKIFFDLRNIKLSHDDDLSDRMSRLVSAALILILATVVSARQCLGEAIHCWCPEVCASNHEKYANLFCWVDDTYYVPFLNKIPHPDERRDRKITYYQWVPLILLLQALLFLAPWMVWRWMAGRSGISIANIVGAASKSQLSGKMEERESFLKYAAFLMKRYLKQRRRVDFCSNIFCCYSKKEIVPMTFKRRTSCLFFRYIIIKLLYLFNAVGQIFLLDKFLGVEFYTFGYHVIMFLLANRRWTPTDRFPHVTLCDFRIRQSTNVHQYTVQCVLPINIFNEKVFAIIWFWLVLVSLITLISLIKWMWSVLFVDSVFEFVRDEIETIQPLEMEEKKEFLRLKHFSKHFLTKDGVFIMKLVSLNAGNLVAAEILNDLWISYRMECPSQFYNNEHIWIKRFRRPRGLKPQLPDININNH